MGIVVSHQFDGVLCRDLMLFHEVSNPQVCLDLPSGFRGFPPGEAISLRRGPPSSPLSGVSSMFGRVASLLVANEALAIPHVLHSFTGREIDLVYIHCIGIGASGSASRRDIAISPSSEFPKLYHISVKLSCFVKPLFPFPASPFLAVREGGGSHHDGELLGHPSLEGIYQDAVVIDSAVHLGQFKGSGVFIKVPIKLVHAEGIDSLSGSIFDVLWNEGFFKGLA